METKHVAKLVALTSLLLATVTAWADPTFDFHVSLDTSSISGTTEELVFELVDGDGAVDNSVVLSNFSFGGGAIAGPVDLASAGVSGDLSGSVSLDDRGGGALFAQPVMFGSSLMFAMTASNNFLGLAPDAFSMQLVVPDFSACYSDDQGTCALIQLDLTGEPLTVASFTLNGAMAQSLPAPVVTVPEPASLLLLATGIGILLPFARRTTGCA